MLEGTLHIFESYLPFIKNFRRRIKRLMLLRNKDKHEK